MNQTALRQKLVAELFGTCLPEVQLAPQVEAALAELDVRDMAKAFKSIMRFALGGAPVRGRVRGTQAMELEYGRGGRIYAVKEGSVIRIARLGTKNSQAADIAGLKRLCPT